MGGGDPATGTAGDPLTPKAPNAAGRPPEKYTWNPHFPGGKSPGTARSAIEVGVWHTTRKFFLQYEQSWTAWPTSFSLFGENPAARLSSHVTNTSGRSVMGGLDSIRNKVMGEIFFAPSVVWPTAAGGIALGAGVALGAPVLIGLGAVGMIGGLGWMAARAIFMPEKISASKLQQMQEEERQAEEKQLDELLKKLRMDRDHRPQSYLNLLRVIRRDFETQAAKPGYELRSMELVARIRQLVGTCVQRLDRSHQLFELSERLGGQEREAILKERELILEEIKASVDQLQGVVRNFSSLSEKQEQAELSEVQNELEASLRVAKRTEERLRELQLNPDDRSFLRE